MKKEKKNHRAVISDVSGVRSDESNWASLSSGGKSCVTLKIALLRRLMLQRAVITFSTSCPFIDRERARRSACFGPL